MLPAEVQAFIDEARTRFREWLTSDVERVALGDLLAAEELAGEVGRALSLGMVEDFVQVRLEHALANRVPCACGHIRAVLQRTRWTRKTPFGPLVITDVYTYCRDCRDSERPLHQWLGTGRETWSLLVQEDVVDLASDESCAKAVAKLERHHPGVQMGRTTALRFLHEHGERARAFIDAKLAAAEDKLDGPPRDRSPGVEELEVEYDAGMIPVATLEPIVPEPGEEPELSPVRKLARRRKLTRYEEVKAGLVQKPGEVDRLYTLRPTGGLTEAFRDLYDLALLKGMGDETEVRGIADGARYIRSRLEEEFGAGKFKFILDRPHCKEHLSEAGSALEEQTGTPAQEWARSALVKLEAGETQAVVDELVQAWERSGETPEQRDDRLRLAAGYFEHNADAVAYAEYRAKGWSTASSEVESCHNSIVQPRLKIGGAFWHPDNVDNILALRVLKANGWWKDYWKEERRKWRLKAEELRVA